MTITSNTEETIIIWLTRQGFEYRDNMDMSCGAHYLLERNGFVIRYWLFVDGVGQPMFEINNTMISMSFEDMKEILRLLGCLNVISSRAGGV